jgi:RsiW-degrading membrane proteinase PrsW (M82 family)
MNARPPGSSIPAASILRPSQPAFWLFAGLLAYGAVRMTTALAELSTISSSGWALSWLLLSVYALPAFALIYYLDLYEREPLSLAIGAALWGAFAATALSLDAAGWDEVVAHVFGAEFATRWGPAITAPIVEETMKGAGVVLLGLVARDEVDDVMDGFVYGALCGLGFAVVEDVLYFMAAFGGAPIDVLQGFYVRVISSGLYGHVLYTGLVGMGVASVIARRPDRPSSRRRFEAAALVLAGVGGHVLWNAPLLTRVLPVEPITGTEWLLVPVSFTIRALPLIAFVALAIRVARDRERRWLDGALATELALGGVTPEEVDVLRAPPRRRAAVRDMRRRAGRAAASLLQRLQREQVNLAMLTVRVPAEQQNLASVAQRAYCRSLRSALHAMPGAAPAGDRDRGIGTPYR